MIILVVLLFAILGLIIGSFLNVVILRMGTGRGLDGRSQCFSCNRQLRWYELLPVVSFLLQRGRCNHCSSKISPQYIIIELVTGILFATIAYQFFGEFLLIPWLVFAVFAVVITGYDMKHHMIPWKPLVGMFVTALFLPTSLWGFFLVPLPFLLIWLASKGKAIGFGDVEIMALLGFVLGISGGFSAVFLAFWIATILVAVWAIVMRKNIKTLRKHPIPFGPFLLLGMYLVGVWGLDIVKYLTTMV